MSSMTAAKLKAILPKCKDPEAWVAALVPAFEKYDIDSRERIAAFLSQTGHESGQFNVLEENLSYSAARLVQVWPKRFQTTAFAKSYERNPEKLANYVYANRIGNGPESSGDGYRFRGRGLIQLTGRSNYATASKAIGIDLLKNPEKLTEPAVAAMSAAWFWASRGLNELADDRTDDNDLEDFTTITKRINGGTVGLQERLALFKAARSALAS